MNKEVLEAMRRSYGNTPLSPKNVIENPIEQFQFWFKNAVESEIYEPNAMMLSTATLDGKPSARIVLLKGIEKNGFRFFTNYDSSKGKAIAENPQVALTFFWDKIHRQVRIEGTVEKISAKDSTNYFQSRPKGSQIGAWASPQSQTIDGREVLEKNKTNLVEKYADAKVLPRPEHWGGYVVIPNRIEFWQGRDNRLHDRVVYQKKESGWEIYRVAP